jgi:putative flippase GtrA
VNAVPSHAIRFVLVGTLNTAFSYLIYAGLLFAGLDYKIANLLTLILGVLFSFKTQGHLVFNNPDNRLLGRFVLSWAFIYVCVTAVIGKIINFGFDAYWAGALALPFSVVLSYLAQRYFVFRKLPIEKI